MKQFFLIWVMLLSVLLLSSCGNTQKNSAENLNQGAISQDESSQPGSGEDATPYTNQDTTEDSNLLKEIPKSFVFSSGSGGWSTHLDLKEDGTFTGTFLNSDMGDSGENYPNGTTYICSFSGSFSEPQQTAPNTYALTLENLSTEDTPSETYYDDGMRYVPADPYGLEGATDFLLYTPGIAMDQLPEEFVFWLYGFFDPSTTDTLPCYAIYNLDGTSAFIAFDKQQ